METELDAFKQEIITIKRLVNGYLSTNPILAEFEIFNISIRKKANISHSKIKIENGFKEDGRKRPDFEKDGCLICYDEFGNPYCHNGDSCPVYH